MNLKHCISMLLLFSVFPLSSPARQQQSAPMKFTSSVTGMNVTAPLGQVFYGQIASFKLCFGWAITAIYADIDWGDGTGITGAEIPDPLFEGRLLGSHTYKSANTYTITIKMTAACWYQADDFQQWTTDTAEGTATATVQPEIAVSSLTLGAASVVRGGTVTGLLSLANPPPSWGTLVQLGSSNASTATVQPGMIVQSGQNATFVVQTQAFTGAARNVTIAAVSGGATVSATLRVR